MKNLYERGLENGLRVEKIGPEELREREPCAAGIAALRVPETGIVDYVGVAEAFVREIAEGGGELRTDTRVDDVSKRGGGDLDETRDFSGADAGQLRGVVQ